MEAMLFCVGFMKLMLTSPPSRSTPAKVDSLFIQTKSEGGSIETEVTDETVMANLFPSFSIDTILTGFPNFLIAHINSAFIRISLSFFLF